MFNAMVSTLPLEKALLGENARRDHNLIRRPEVESDV